ncbi:hypothetical protein AMECASPLE_012808 [Ameca splendens]|uniref:Uncharacterized protein n=1 Tax=Ameca splendens TaxID=208324 RepID=A0ABV0ZMQ6_9TELE
MAPDNDVRLTGESGVVHQGRGAEPGVCVDTACLSPQWLEWWCRADGAGRVDRVRSAGRSLRRVCQMVRFRIQGSVPTESQWFWLDQVRSRSQHLKVAGQGEISARVPTKNKSFLSGNTK